MMGEPLHLHLLSVSTGETPEVIAKACLSRFEGAEVLRHFWPMVRPEGYLDQALDDIERRPGLVIDVAGRLIEETAFAIVKSCTIRFEEAAA